MKKAVIISVLSALILASCNEVPEDVKSRTEEQQARQSAAADDSKAYADSNFDPYKKVPLSEVKAELEGYQFKKHDNLNFVCKPSPLTADEIYNINVLLGYGFTADENDKTKLIELTKKIMNIDSSEFIFSYLGPLVSSNTIKEGTYGQLVHGVNSYAFYCYSTVNAGERNKIEFKPYKPESYPSEKLKMADGTELSVDEAIKQGEGYIKLLRELGLFDENEAQKLFRISIGTAAGKGSVIHLRYQQTQYGLPVDEGGTHGDYPTRSPHFDIYFAGSNNLMQIDNWQSQKATGKEPVSEIIPLSSAEYLASDGLAPNMKFDVSEAELRYLCITWDELHHDIDIEEEDNHEFTLKPFWCFTLKENAEPAKYTEEFLRTELYIDALTGELYYGDTVKKEFLTRDDLMKMV